MGLGFGRWCRKEEESKHLKRFLLQNLGFPRNRYRLLGVAKFNRKQRQKYVNHLKSTAHIGMMTGLELEYFHGNHHDGIQWNSLLYLNDFRIVKIAQRRFYRFQYSLYLFSLRQIFDQTIDYFTQKTKAIYLLCICLKGFRNTMNIFQLAVSRTHLSPAVNFQKPLSMFFFTIFK